MVTTIQIDPAVRDRLKRFGHAGMTYDEILKMFMDRWEEEEWGRAMRQRIDELDATDGWEELDESD